MKKKLEAGDLITRTRTKQLADGSKLTLLRKLPGGLFRVEHSWATGYEILIMRSW